MTEREQLNEKKKEIARNTDLVALLTHLGYHVVQIGRYHSLKEMDSIRIYNRKTWSRFSDLSQGGDVIKWMTEMEDMKFWEAVDYLVEFNGGQLKEVVYNSRRKSVNRPPEPERKPFVLPAPAKYQTRLYEYLENVRGLSHETVCRFHDAGLIYLSDKFHNIVFVGKDAAGIPRHAAMRGTYPTKPFKGDCAGSNKSYGFNLHRNSDILVVTEAAIDIMSYYEITHDETSSLLSMGGTADNPLEKYLVEHPEIRHIKLLLDADEAGSEAVIRLIDKYSSPEWADRGITIEDIRYQEMASLGCKDVNELLIYMKQSLGEILSPYPYPFPKQTEVEKGGAVTESDFPEQAISPVEESGKSDVEEENGILADLLLSSLRQANERMFQLREQSLDGKADECEVIMAMGAAQALYNICCAAGLDPPLPGEEKNIKKNPVMKM